MIQANLYSDWQGYSPTFCNQPGYDITAHYGYGQLDHMRFHGDVGIGR